jgi:hypothetical protein
MKNNSQKLRGVERITRNAKSLNGLRLAWLTI